MRMAKPFSRWSILLLAAGSFISISCQASLEILAAAAQGAAGVDYSTYQENEITSYVTSATLGDRINVQVQVSGTGPAFGYGQSSLLTIYGNESFPNSPSSTWTIFNNEGWPESYEVAATYTPYVIGESGVVHVTVICNDFSHPNYGDDMYSELLGITWQ